MAVLVQGQVADRPWGQTLGALGLRALTGQLTLHGDDGKGYAIAFANGEVTGAWSPNAADSAPRVALTNHMLSSTQVQPIVRRISSLPDRDEVDVVAEMARLSLDQVSTLRSKLVAQRAARTFSIDSGVFVVDDEITIPVSPPPGIDVRHVVYLGSRLNLSEQRLSTELRAFGAYFQLKREAAPTLDRYGFTESESLVLAELRAGTSLHELEAAHREADPRMVQAIVYALFACQACDISEAPAMPRAATMPTVRVTTRASLASITTPPVNVDAASVVPPSEMDAPPARPSRPPSEPQGGAAVYERMKRASSKPQSSPEFPQRTPTPPVVGRTSSEYFMTPQPSGTGEFPTRSLTPPVTPRALTENPFDFRTPTPPVTGLSPPRALTENPFPLRSPTPPQTGRTPSENEYTTRPPTPPRPSRTQTDNPFPARMLTPPVESRTTSGRKVGAPVAGADEGMVARNQRATNAPRTMTPGPNDPINPPTNPPTNPPANPRTATPRPGGAPASPRAGTANPTTARTGTGDPVVSRTGTGNGPAIARTTTARKTAALIAARMILLEQGADHFALLGVPFDAPVEQVTATYLNLVRQLHPEKLAEIDLEDGTGNAQKLFAAIGGAFAVLTDPTKRTAYIASLVGAGQPRTKTGEEAATPAMEAFRRGESALRRDEPHEAVEHFKKAVELSPQDVDFNAMYGWALFCASREKDKQANETRKLLERALQKSQKPMQARFLLGRVERMLGNDERALRHFNIVLEDTPTHTEARAEVRAIETRLASGIGKKR